DRRVSVALGHLRLGELLRTDLGAILREAFLHRFQRHRLAVIGVLIPAHTRVVVHADDVEGAVRERFGRRYPDPADVFHGVVFVVMAGDVVETGGRRPGRRLQIGVGEAEGVIAALRCAIAYTGEIG